MGGLTMPAYAYYLARGRERKDPAKSNAWNDSKRSFLRTYAVERGDGMRCPP